MIIAATALNHIWKAEEYHRHSSAQQTAAMQLLEEVVLTGEERLLDVGCGDGKISAALAQRLPRATVTGIDASEEMIAFAKKTFPLERYPNLTFLVQNAQQMNLEGLDLIFSSFALQWLPDPRLFFERAQENLKESGKIVATIPLGISDALEQAVKEVRLKPQWSPYFERFSPGWHFQSAATYRKLLEETGFATLRFSEQIQKTLFSDRCAFENYVLPWFSYLNVLPETCKVSFFKEVVDRYLELSPLCSDKSVVFQFARVDFIGVKPAL